MPDIEITDDVRERHVVNAVDAREQASEGRYSFLRSAFRRTKDGKEVFEIPHRDLFDYDQQERWDDLQDAINNDYQREPDVMTPDGKTLIAKGALIVPHRDKNNKRLPQWAYRLGIVLWGEQGAARAKAGGINFNEIEIVWQKQLVEMEERMNRDPKSQAGSAGVEAVSQSD